MTEDFPGSTRYANPIPSCSWQGEQRLPATLTVTDDGGAIGSDTQNVTVTEPSTGFTLTANGYKVRGRHNIDLTWSGATGTDVDVYRDGSKIATTANDGFYTDSTNNRGGVSYVYQVCEEGGTTCSNEATLVF